MKTSYDHFRQTLPAVAATELSTLKTEAEQYEIIGIDEGQFVSTVPKTCTYSFKCAIK